MEGLGARGQTGKRRNVVRRAKCQFCKDGPLVSAKHYRVHRVHLKAHCYSRGVTPRDEVGSEYGCRHCEVVTFTPGLMMDHLIGSHPAELGPVHGWERVTQHMPPVAEPAAVVSDEATKAFVVQLAEANADLRQGMADLVDGWAKLEAEVEELKAAAASAQKPAKLEGLAAKLFRGWSEKGADAFYDK